MKKWTACLTAGLMAVSLCSCGQSQGSVSSVNRSESGTVQESSQEAGTDQESGSAGSDAKENDSSASPSQAAESAGSTIVTNGGETLALSELSHETSDTAAPEVFYLSDISSAALMKAYQALDWTPTGKVAVKISTGEPPASYYLRPELTKDLVQKVNGTIVETNTAYGGRSSTAMHIQVAKDHGFTDIANVDIMDADGEMSLPVTGGTHLKEDVVGSHYADYGSFVILSHFKGHPYGGFGGAVKNTSIGIASREGRP